MVLAPLLWAMAGVVSRQLESAQRFEVTFWRSCFAGVSLLVLLPLMRWWDGSATASIGRPAIARWWGVSPRSRSFWISGLCWSVMFTAFMLAMTMTSVAHVLVLLAAGPLFTAVLASRVLRQPQPLRTWVAVWVAGAGIVYMFGSQWLQALADPAIDTSRLVIGTLVALCVPIGGAINWTVVQRSQRHGQQIDLVPAVMVGGLLSALGTAALSWPWQASSRDLAWLAFLGVFQLAVPCAIAVICARVLKAAEVSLLAQLEVIFGILLVWWLAGEVPAPQVLVGGSVVLAALVGNELAGWKDRRETPRIQTLSAHAPAETFGGDSS
ncbi:MAG: DMT family transporter [Hydrogenophaga sp.]|nr:DMT family transporter [Hydrogenophaga sp.]